MNILVISSVFTPEPIVISTMSEDIAVELSRANNVTVLAPKPTRPYGSVFNSYDFSQKPYTRIELSSYTCAKTSFVGRFVESVSFGRHAYRYIKENRESIDKIYAWAWPLYGQKYIVKAAKKYNIPVIIHVQDVYPEPFLRRLPIFKKLFYNLFLPVDKYVLQNATRIITIAPKIAEYLCKTRILEPGKVDVIYNWQSNDKFKNIKTNQVKDPFTFLFLGTLSGATNLDFILNVYAKSTSRNSQFVIAGNGSFKEKLVALTKKLDLQNIIFIDAAPDKVSEIQSMADVLIISLKPGGGAHAFPSKLTAYMYSKKPILACVDENCDIAHTIEQAGCGWVSSASDEDKLLELFNNLPNEDSDCLKQKGDNGFIYCEGNLSKNINLAKIISIINNL